MLGYHSIIIAFYDDGRVVVVRSNMIILAHIFVIITVDKNRLAVVILFNVFIVGYPRIKSKIGLKRLWKLVWFFNFNFSER